MNKPKILFLVEGAKTDVRLMQKLLSVYGFDQKYDIPDAHFNEYFATQEELSNGTYKQRVNQENRNRNYTKFAVTKEECNAVIQLSYSKILKRHAGYVMYQTVFQMKYQFFLLNYVIGNSR